MPELQFRVIRAHGWSFSFHINIEYPLKVFLILKNNKMFVIPMLFTGYFVHLVAPLHLSGGLFGYVFGFQRICFCRCGLSHRYLSEYSRTSRLLGGEATTAHQFPWLAAVNVASRSVGGSLVSDRHVVTAASPLHGKSYNEISVTLGAHDRCGDGSDPILNTSVSAIHIHPGFSPTTRDNDIALLRLRHVVPFSRFILPICMPHYGAPEVGQVAWTAAWTGLSSNASCIPRVATFPILPTSSCIKGTRDTQSVTPDKGCLGPLGAKNIICEADVGAPVMQRYYGSTFKLLGLLSSSSCDRVTSPLYTRIIDHAGWIYQHIHNDCQCI